MRYKHLRRFILLLVCVHSTVHAANWPSYQGNNARSGITNEHLALPLAETWNYHATQAPRPAWPAPAKRDIWHEIDALRPTVTYDRAYQTVASDGKVYFGSSATDDICCLDAATGALQWRFFTQGPVRLAPALAHGNVYAGSDDGSMYCLDAATGEQIWQRQIDPEANRIPGNGRIICSTPIRTGALVIGDVVHVFAGLFPSQGVFYCALNAQDGAVIWKKRLRDFSPQGYLLASANRLFVPTGRTTPGIFDPETGRFLGEMEGRGGAYAVVVNDALVSGPGRSTGGLDLTDTATRESIVQFDGLRMLVKKGIAYVQSDRKFYALDHVHHTELAHTRHGLTKQRREHEEQLGALEKDTPEALALITQIDTLNTQIDACTSKMRQCILWTQPSWTPFSFILTKDFLFAGGDGEVAAFSAATGEVLWTGKVSGKAYGLAVADGALLVSTDQGIIHCFRHENPEREYVNREVREHTPYPADAWSPVYADAAQHIIDALWPDASTHTPLRGYCLVAGCGEGRLAYELARRTQMTIVCVEREPKRVAAARDALSRAGLYGTRISVLHGELDELSLTSYVANVIVSDDAVRGKEITADIHVIERLLKPYGGLAIIGQPRGVGRKRDRLNQRKLEGWLRDSSTPWQLDTQQGLWCTYRRGAAAGAGEWTQLYANAAHTACSTDTLKGPMRIQWFGRPGPREMIDRHHRPMSSLFKDGRNFIPANDRIITIDPYNGTPLWKLDVPNSRRVGALRNCGHMVVTNESLLVAVEDKCWSIDVETGVRNSILNAPQLRQTPRDWGYLNHMGNQLFGSGMKAEASLRRFGKSTINKHIEGDFRPMIASDYLFSLDAQTGKVLWTYDKKSVIMNNGITLGEGRIYFVESRSPRALSNKRGRLRVDRFFESDTELVALDARSGRKVWRQAVTFPYDQIMFLSNSQGVLLATGTDNVGELVQYDLYGFDSATGDAKWHNSCQNGDAIGGAHGEQWQHPAIIGNRIFCDPFAFDLQTGERQAYLLERGGGGCGGLTASAHYLYGRGANPRMYPIDKDKTNGIRLTHVSRPGCWLNIIPAGGIVMLPESSSGCTCGYPLQTSFAFIPESAL